MANYKVLVGIDYGNKRAEVGDTVSDIPAKSTSWLLEQNCIELIGDPATVSPKKKKPEVDIEVEEIE